MKEAHHTILILVLAMLGVGLILVPLGLDYKIHRVGDHMVAVMQEATAIEEAQSASLETRRAALESQTSLTALSSHILTDDDVVIFLSDLETLSSQTGTTVKISNVEATTPQTSTINTGEGIVTTTSSEKASLKVSLEATGQFSQVYQLLQVIETLPYEISINEENLTATTDLSNGVAAIPNTNSIWSLNLTLTVLSYKIHETIPTQK